MNMGWLKEKIVCRLARIQKKSSRKKTGGFSLLELSIGLTIVSILAAGALTVGGVVVDQQRFVDTNTRVDDARKALEDYFKVNGRLPCVAPQNIAIGATGYGTELANCATGAAATGATIRIRTDGSACTAAATDANCVRIGALPVRTLGLSDAAAADDYGNKLFYAVTEDMTDATKVTAATGRVTIQDGTGAVIADGSGTTGAAFTVVSPGPDGKGAYKLISGAQALACSGSGLDLENCNNNAVFRDTQFNNGNQTASFYDDIPTWMPKYQLTTASATAANTLWTESGNNLYATGSDNDVNTGNVGIGTVNPSYRFDVQQTRAETSTFGVRGYVARNYLNVAPTGVSSAYQTALINSCEVTTANNITGDVLCNYNAFIKNTGGSLNAAYGSYADTLNTSTGTIGFAFGAAANIGNTGNGSIGTALGIQGYTYNSSTGSITNAYGINGVISNLGSGSITASYGGNFYTQNYSGSITTAYGAYNYVYNSANGTIGTAIAGRFGVNKAAAATTTNGFGVYIDDVQASNQWGLYQASADDMNYFGGNILMGNDPAPDPNHRLRIYQNRAGGTGVFSYAPQTTSIGLYAYVPGGNSNGVVSDIGGGAGSNAYYAVSSGNSSNGLYAYIAGSGSYGVNVNADNLGAYALAAYNSVAGTGCYIGFNGYSISCFGGTYALSSDRRLKEEIVSLADREGLDVIMALKPVHFQWKGHKDKKINYGFIAQDVEKVLPDLVGEVQAPPVAKGKKNTFYPLKQYKSLDYNGLIAPTVLAVQQLKQENDALTARVKALEANAGESGAQAVAALKENDAGVFGIAYKQLTMLLGAMLFGVFGTLLVRRK